MLFDTGETYHIYNRSFGHNTLFKTDSNYRFFLTKVAQLVPITEIIAYCLMPDHNHLLVFIPEGSEAVNPIENGTGTGTTAQSGQTGRRGQAISMQMLARKIGTIQSSYSQAMNKTLKKTGSWFQPKAKAKRLEADHLFNCFHYIHQNPLKAKLVKRMEDWRYSSFGEYLLNEPAICNVKLARDMIDIPIDKDRFLEQSYAVASGFDFEPDI